MAISMVRQPSETPNINNISDIIPFRYAYGGQNGYVKGKGRELDYTAIGNQFTVGSGRVVLDGVESDIDSDGVVINVDTVSETRYYVVYYNVNLANNTTTITSQYATGSYPTIFTGDDLTENPEGSANLVLYRFTATSGIISNVEKVVQPIEYTGDALDGYDISKGTIEQRLDALGFKRGSVVLADGITATRNELKRQGNYVLGRLTIDFNDVISFYTYNIGTIPEEFLPAQAEEGSAIGKFTLNATNLTANYTYTVKLTISTTGELKLVTSFTGSASGGSVLVRFASPVELNFGYEANPL